MRTIGAIGTTRDLSSGDHVSWTYSSDAEHREVLSAFFAEGAARGERLVYFAPRSLRERLPDYLGSGEFNRLVGSGRLLTLPTEDAFGPGTAFDPDAVLGSWESLTRDAVAEGFPGLRAAGEAGWLLGHVGTGHAFDRYEFGAELLAEAVPLTALCCYDARTIHPAGIGTARAFHPKRLGPASFEAGFTMTSAGAGRVALSGEVDFVHAPAIGTLLIGAAGRVRELDLSGLRFADGAAVRALAEAAGAIASLHGSVQFRGAPPAFRRIWDVLGLGGQVAVSFESAGHE